MESEFSSSSSKQTLRVGDAASAQGDFTSVVCPLLWKTASVPAPAASVSPAQPPEETLHQEGARDVSGEAASGSEKGASLDASYTDMFVTLGDAFLEARRFEEALSLLKAVQSLPQFEANAGVSAPLYLPKGLGLRMGPFVWQSKIVCKANAFSCA